MIFLDSSFLVAYAVDGDSNHTEAAELMGEIADSVYGPPVISDYVFDETATVTFLRTGELQKAKSVGDAMLRAFRMFRVDERTFREAWRRFRGQRGTKYSFTDCTTLEVMAQNGVTRIATFDREFRTAKGVEVMGARQPH
jgi:predicted nucleic acid-binding protein